MRQAENDNEIVHLYKEGKGAKDICSILCVAKTTVFRALKRNGIEVRGCKKKLDVEYICQEYLSGRSTYSIAEELGENDVLIGKTLRRAGIELRDRKECQKAVDGDKIISLYISGMSRAEIMKEVGCSNSVITRYLKNAEINPGKLSPKIDVQKIIDTYLEVGSVTETAKILSLSPSVASKHLNKAEIAVSKNKVAGSLHWNWKGGITPRIESLRHSDEFKRWRKSVYKRDGYNCMMPGCDKHGGEIHAHHIIPIYEEESKIFDINNGITLCRDCHEKTYGKELEYVKIFRDIIKD